VSWNRLQLLILMLMVFLVAASALLLIVRAFTAPPKTENQSSGTSVIASRLANQDSLPL
jgi:hypothetical protein